MNTRKYRLNPASLPLPLLAALTACSAPLHSAVPSVHPPLLLQSQTVRATNTSFSFPEDWQGAWSGTCQTVSKGGNAIPSSFEMQLTVRPQASQKWQWKIEYRGSDLNQVRNYELIAVDTAKGHFAIDEKNGIFLDTFLLKGNLFIEQFEVSGSRITVKHQLQDKRTMRVEFLTFATQPVRSSAAGEFKVDSFPLLNYQDCQLSKG